MQTRSPGQRKRINLSFGDTPKEQKVYALLSKRKRCTTEYVCDAVLAFERSLLTSEQEPSSPRKVECEIKREKKNTIDKVASPSSAAAKSADLAKIALSFL